MRLALLIAVAFCAGCSTSRPAWSGDRPALDQVRGKLRAIYQAERGDAALADRLSVRVETAARLQHPHPKAIAETAGAPHGSRFVCRFADSLPPQWAAEHEAGHVYLIREQGRGDHPADFGRRHRLQGWRD